MKEFNINNYLRKSLLSIVPYQSAREEVSFKNKNIVFLDANENPYQNELNRYPDPFQLELKKKIALIKKVNVNSIFLANGSDDVLGLLINAFCEPVIDSIIVLPPTFGMYEVLAKINNVNVKKIPLNNEFQLDIKSILNSVDSNIKMIFITTPNNPTGNSFKIESILEILTKFQGLVLVDEAYLEFSREKTTINLIKDYPNLIVCQTFSKAQGLAGVRLGMCFANKEVISVLNKIKYPYNLNSLSQKVVLERLLKSNIVHEQVKEILSQRDFIVSVFQFITFIKKIFPSDANFILIRVDKAILRYNQLIDRNIVVRNTSKQLMCENTLRISIGTPEENQKLIIALKEMDD